ncbi:GNAT family N-acetyltransferase [Polycladidibacter stylochi]|uniref:GNAT family N-acetyltransferase n=1 Tax=Polycladidibacter stylochi TaxID=1807766 RepID=UPI000834F985|nr:GNAT family N-acetyltransferase [Pseudovibrio stylochi]
MVITEAKCEQGPAPVCTLERVLRLEQANLNSFPAYKNHFDGGWITRLTPQNPSRRINSLNFYEPSDNKNIEARLMQSRARFANHSIPFHIRWTPLMPKDVEPLALQLCPQRLGETIVLERTIWALGEPDLPASYTLERCQLADFILAFKEIGGTRDAVVQPHALKSLEVALSAVPAQLLCLKASDSNGRTAAVLLGVIDDDCLGIFDVATAPWARRQGLARALVIEVQRLGAEAGAQTAWLQAVTVNTPAQDLYSSLGYKEAYRYHYLKPK